jgi:RNA polymerase sigma-70 factor (ECF subfamily)
MAEPNPFTDLMTRVRAGDHAAAAELVELYGPAIRRAARHRMRDQRLRQIFDSMDICQSVMGSFFVRAAVGQYELNTPEQLMALLARMAHNKVINQLKREQAGRRDFRRRQGKVEEIDQAAAGETPSQIVAGRDLVQTFRDRLSEEERWLAEQRAQGRAWDELAAEKGMTPQALRMKLHRALNRVARELCLD